MTYKSVDDVQKLMAKNVFGHTESKKKAAGRALGTLVEIITFYLLDAWGFSDSIAIERGLPEYANPAISHNVEYSLHPVVSRRRARIKRLNLPLTTAKILRLVKDEEFEYEGITVKSQTFLDRNSVLKNACIIALTKDKQLVCLFRELSQDDADVDLIWQYRKPYAIVECKRVGVEEGVRKGPQTIEKAKQGAYVAKVVSSLQKVRAPSGEQYGIVMLPNGEVIAKPYTLFLDDTLHSQNPELLRNFVMTIGISSNHGNWFTSENPNKEMLVLSQSYDWLLFLSDEGLSTFVNEVLYSQTSNLLDARKAFLRSYGATTKGNEFTKVKMGLKAHLALQTYFKKNLPKIESWFNIISPSHKRISELRRQILTLAKKDWKGVIEK